MRPHDRPASGPLPLIASMATAGAVALGAGVWFGLPATAAVVAAAVPPGALAWLAARRAARAEAAGGLLADAIDGIPCNFAVFAPDRTLLVASDGYRALHAEALTAAGDRPVRYDDLMRMAVVRTIFPDPTAPGASAGIEAEVARRVEQHEGEAPQGFDRLYPDGRWMRVVKQRLPGGQVAGMTIDITAIKQRERALQDSEAQARLLLESAPIGIWELDKAGGTRSANARLARLFPGELPPARLDDAGFRRTFPDDPAGPFGFPTGREVEVGLPLADGGEKRLLIAASPWLGDGDRCVLTVIDITPLKQAQAQAEHLAEHDPLTGLANRARFRAALEALVIEGGGGGALVTIDLDQFKQTNARFGHVAGDALLVAVAERMAACVRPGDVCCRVGGDEFAVIAPGAEEAGARAIAARLQRAMRMPLLRDGAELTLSASIGIAIAPTHGRTADELQRAADLAMFGVKQAGRNAALVFRPALREAVDRRDAMREALIMALERDEFHLEFQAQWNVSAQAMVGAEALLRWNSSRLGRAVPPSEIFPAASDARLLDAIDAWVMEAALRQAAAWRGVQGAPAVIAVNATVLSLRDPGFADRIAGALLRHGVAPSALEIEIPEDLAVRDIAPIEATLARLRAIGVGLALDDFGGGLSSLQHVVRLPVQRLKLDRSIVAGLDRSPGNRAVLRATVALARGMGIEVLAEGVETEAEAFAVRREGCTIIQGWLTGQPVRAEILVPPESRRIPAAG
ncbi:putative bifunctional diguanylate cyclase/phosphodiesterase [Humitalea sp. 24SJ18S-53]|uniref:putative bifunctional diguanylate cyclase/phosphodiesterase n=1 Tax=Humitalea sp. 24SJ18S-53 TaxID=3422307 RepID=UPI003D66C4A4